MILNVVKDLVSKHSKDEIDRAITAFETKRENLLNVEGPDDGEKLSNLLAASEVRARMDNGMPLNEAVRDFSQRVRSVLSKPNKPRG